MKKLAALAAMAVLLCASASFAKKAMDEGELDLVTAAGQPLIISVGVDDSDTADITIDAGEANTNTLTIGLGAQTNLRALALNNVAGENQVANGINIQAGVGLTIGLGQDNAITQSWGATFDWSFVEGITATAPGGAGSVSQTGGTNTAGATVCVLTACVDSGGGDVVGIDGSGGDGAADGTDNLALSAYADKIIFVGELEDDATLDIMQTNADTNTLTILDQADLAALAVNNIVGSNQVANAFNLASQSNIQVGVGAVAAIKFDTSGATATFAGQSNTINQFRGTPFARP